MVTTTDRWDLYMNGVYRWSFGSDLSGTCTSIPDQIRLYAATPQALTYHQIELTIRRLILTNPIQDVDLDRPTTSSM